MPRRKNPEIAVRNEVIYAKWRSGRSLVSLGEEYKRAPQVIGRIVASFHPEGDEDGERSLFRGYLWRLFDEVREVYDAPGWKMSPNGTPAMGPGPDPEPAEDVMAKIEAAKLQLQVLESLRKLDARDKAQQRQHMSEQEARDQMQAHLAGIAVAVAGERAALEERHRLELEAVRQSVQPPVVRGAVMQRGEEGLRSG